MADREADGIAARAAQVADRARITGDQLNLFGEPTADLPAETPERTGGPGRPPGARNKAKTRLRDLLVAHGYGDPAHRVARLAGLHSSEDIEVIAIKRALVMQSVGDLQARLDRAEALLDRAQPGKERDKAFQLVLDAERALIRETEGLPALAVQIAKEMRQAAEALLPYVHEKRTADVQVAQTVQIGVAAPAGAPVQAIRSVGPPPMPQEKIEGNQEVIDHVPTASDGEDRT